MSDEQENPSPEEPRLNIEVPEADEIVVINFDEIKPNSVLIIKIKADSVSQRITATQQIATALRPLREQIREKNVVLVVMSTEESFETVNEEQMNKFGWYKKEESSIIIPR